MASKVKLTEAQAKRLAGMFAESKSLHNWERISPTDLALLKRGYVTDTRIAGTFPSGAEYTKCILNNSGIAALADFFAGRALLASSGKTGE